MLQADSLEQFNYDTRDDFDIDECDGVDHDEDEKLQNYIFEHGPPPEKWYHGRLDRKDGENRLRQHGRSCCYLLRESDRKPGIYSLSYLSMSGHISHFRVTAICGDYYIGGRKFQSLQHLIGYYSTYGSLVKNEKLKEPVASPEPVHLAYRVVARFPYTATNDTDELSFSIGDVFSVQNVLDDDWFWAVAQKDNKSGLVPKALTEEMDSSADPFEGQSWFASVTKQDAQTILMNYGRVGNFLIRPSDNQGDYSISLRDQNGVTRYLIRRQGQRFLFGGRTYDSIEDIISRYNTEQLAEGLSLGLPLDRSKYEGFYRNLQGSTMRRTEHEDGATKLPQIRPLRLSSVISESSSVTKNGFLIKRGNRNKWRRYYMILRGDDQQLLYFENERRTKPKGLFDLTYAVVYYVHESLFGRPNCFQIVVRAYNEVQTYFLCADSSDAAQGNLIMNDICDVRQEKYTSQDVDVKNQEKGTSQDVVVRNQEWVEAITKFCGKLNTHNKNTIMQNVKELKSLEITICHAQKIPVNKLPHPYCVISLNDVKTCRTKAKDAPEPVFDEEFKFHDLPSDITSFTVALYNRQRSPYKDKEMGRVTVYLNTLEPGKVLDQWFVLGSQQHKSEMGSIRLTAKFVHETIMPVDEYGKLKEVTHALMTSFHMRIMCYRKNVYVKVLVHLVHNCDVPQKKGTSQDVDVKNQVLLSREYSLVQSLGEVSKDLNALAHTLLRIFRQDKTELNLIKTITSRELHTKEKKETLFRGNTLGTKLMDQYMKMIAIPYLQNTIKNVILKIMESKQNCELNPSKVEKGSNVAENLQQLIKFLEEITSNIFNSATNCPNSLRYLFHCLQQEALGKWPDEPYIQSRVVGSFLFLRLIVPAVLNPKMHNLVHESPTMMSSRTLTLVAMCLQKLANLVEFGAKEPYLVVVNPFLQKYRTKMVDFLDEISDLSEPPSTIDVFKHDLARDLAAIHETCVKHEHQLIKISSTQPHVRILLAIVQGIKQQKEQFMKQAASECDEYAV